MKLAIIIPTIGRPTLQKTLEAILPQIENTQHSLYLSYDGLSSDPNYKDLQSQYNASNIHFFSTNKPKSGASNARNIAIQKAILNSEIIAFLGDDTAPEDNWLQKTLQWHTKNPQENQAVFGRIYWIPELAKDPLHIWLENNTQFDFKNLDNGRQPDWRHFTTSNISLKSSIFQNPTNLFNTKFKGWGFEDGELGYRLQTQKNLQISYVPNIKVFHDHPQNFNKVLQNLQNARKNALLFQKLHPELQILPAGIKKVILFKISLSTFLIPKFISSRAYWWSRTKLVWLGFKFPVKNTSET